MRRGATSSAGAIRTIGADGGGGREVVATPGHYVEPSFSRDGQRIVYRAVEGDDVRGPENGEQPGIFVVPAAGGASTLVREEGSNPRFDATGTRLYFQERREQIGRCSPASRPATPSRSCTRAPRTPSSWCRRRTAGGSRSRSAGAPTSPRCRRAADRSRSGRPRRRFRWPACRAIPAGTCTGPTRTPFTGRWAPISTPATWRRRSPSRGTAPRSPTSPRRRASPSASSRPATRQRGRSRWSAPASCR